MATSTDAPPKKAAKRGTKVLQMEPQTPFDTPQSVPETDDPPPVEARPPVSKGSTNPKPFPMPPKASLKGGYCEEAVGMAYWRSIPEEFKDRLTVYINREHPVLNRMVEVTTEDAELMRQHKKRYPIKYIDLPPEPFSEDTAGEFLNRYGSGKYKVFINDVGIKGAKDPNLQSRNLCKFLVKVYDSDSPPILDPSRPDKGLGVLDWTHPENQSYVAELRTRGIFPPDEKAGDSVAESVVTTLVDKISDLSDRVGVHETDRLVDRIAEKINGGGGGQSRASETLQIMQATKEMLTPSTAAATANPPAPPADPFDTADKIMKMRQNDPMITLLLSRMDSQDKALEEARKREFELLKERATSPPAKNLLDQALEFIDNPDKLERVKKLANAFGFGGGEAPVRAGRTTGWDIFDHFVSGPAGAAIAQGLGQVLMTVPAMFQGNPANSQQPLPTRPPEVLPPIQGPPPPETPEQRIQRIGVMWTRPLISEFFMKNAPGDAFAESMWDVAPDDYVFLKSFGAENLVDRYRRFPQAWTAISYRPPSTPGVTSEQEFIAFMQAFCAWQPPKEEDEQPQPASDGVEDLEDKEDEA